MRTRDVDGSKIRHRREELGLEVVDLAREARCTRWHIYGIESGRHQPGPARYELIRQALRVDRADEAALLLADPDPAEGGEHRAAR